MCICPRGGAAIRFTSVHVHSWSSPERTLGTYTTSILGQHLGSKMELDDSACRGRHRTRAILLHLAPYCTTCTSGPAAATSREAAGAAHATDQDLLAAVEREKVARAQRAKAWAAARPTDPSPARCVNDREIVIGPDYAPAPEIARADNLADSRRGALHELTMLSVDSEIYPGIERKPSVPDVDPGIPDSRFRGLGLTPDLFKGDADVLGHAFNSTSDTPEISRPAPYNRQVVVYLPPGLNRAAPAPFVIVNDGPGYVDTMAKVVDSLIADNRLPHNLIVLFVASGGGDAQGSQRGLEYDTCSGLFAEFIDKEVVPFVSAKCGVHLTSNPSGRATMGGSSGGCAAFSMAWYRPVRASDPPNLHTVFWC